MKKIVGLIVGLICASFAQAQELKFKMKPLDDDLYARTHERLDLNNNPCAVVRVSGADIKSYVFEGYIIGDVIYSTGEALIYMTRGTRKIKIKNDKYGVFRYEFPKNMRLESSQVYQLRIIPPLGDFFSFVKLKFESLSTDVYARTHERLDLNNNPCAVVRISGADIKSYVFEGNIIGNVIYSTGEALVYLPKNSKFITIKNDKYGTIRYDFPMELKERQTYSLWIKLKKKALRMK